jgi:hypothetical protein
MRKSKIAIAAMALTSAAAFAAGGLFTTRDFIQSAAAAAAATGTDTAGYMPVGMVTNTSSYTTFLRLGNGASTAATFTLLVAAESGAVGSKTVTVTVPPYAAVVQRVSSLVTQSAATLAASGRATIYVKSTMAGRGAAVQILVVNPNGALTTNTHCVFDSTLAYDATVGTVLLGIPGPAYASNYPGFLWITNPDATARVITGSYYEANTGAHIDEFYASSIPANGSVLLALSNTSAQTLADARNPSAATALPGLASAKDWVTLVLRSGDSSPLTAVVNPLVISPNGTLSAISEFCPVNPAHAPSTGTNPSGGSGSGSGGGAVTPSGS